MSITINMATKLNRECVFDILSYFDMSSTIPLHIGLEFKSYSQKLSDNALFIIASDGAKWAGFIAFYLNSDEHFIYVPQVVVHKDFRHKGIGHLMFVELYNLLSDTYTSIKLEVLKTNDVACAFYGREGFIKKEDRGEKIFLEKVSNTFFYEKK